MEFIDGMNLEHYLQTEQGKQMSWMNVLSIAKDIAAAMNYIHEQNVIHLDLRCANVMVMNTNTTYLLCVIQIEPDSILYFFLSIIYNNYILNYIIDRYYGESVSE